MMNGPPGAPWNLSQTETKDGVGSADHDQPYIFGHQVGTRDLGPFTQRQFCRLLCLRGRLRAAAESAPALRREAPASD